MEIKVNGYIFVLKIGTLKSAKDINELQVLLQEDNTLAFNMFYEMYYDQVFRYAYYFLKNAESCREVVADVFFAVWQSRKRLKDIGNLETYLFVSVRNEVARYRKKNGCRERVPLDELPVHLEVTTEESPHDKVSYQEMEQLLSRIVGGLPEKCRLIFLMARQERLKPKEIAERLCISESTVRVQMKIAIEKIIRQLKPYYPELTLSMVWAFAYAIG